VVLMPRFEATASRAEILAVAAETADAAVVGSDGTDNIGSGPWKRFFLCFFVAEPSRTNLHMK
jgi:hypothetical protein